MTILKSLSTTKMQKVYLITLVPKLIFTTFCLKPKFFGTIAYKAMFIYLTVTALLGWKDGIEAFLEIILSCEESFLFQCFNQVVKYIKLFVLRGITYKYKSIIHKLELC